MSRCLSEKNALAYYTVEYFMTKKSFVTSASGVLSFHLHLSPRFDYEEPIVETKGVLSNFIQKQAQQQK